MNLQCKSPVGTVHYQMQWLEGWGLESPKDPFIHLCGEVVGCCQGAQLERWFEYLAMAVPCGCLASL